MPTYVSQVTHYPAIERINAMREVLEAAVRARQAQGRRTNLMNTAGVSHEGPIFVTTSLWGSLAEYEQAISSGAIPPANNAAIAALQRQTQWGELRELVVELPPMPAGAAPRPFVHRMRFTPAPGHLPALRDLFKGRVEGMNAASDRGILSATLTGRPQLVWTRWYESMAQWEEARTRGLADPAGLAFMKETAPMMFEPPVTQLFRVLIPMPPA